MLGELPASRITTAEVEMHAAPVTAAITARPPGLLPRTLLSTNVTTKYHARHADRLGIQGCHINLPGDGLRR